MGRDRRRLKLEIKTFNDSNLVKQYVSVLTSLLFRHVVLFNVFVEFITELIISAWPSHDHRLLQPTDNRSTRMESTEKPLSCRLYHPFYCALLRQTYTTVRTYTIQSFFWTEDRCKSLPLPALLLSLLFCHKIFFVRVVFILVVWHPNNYALTITQALAKFWKRVPCVVGLILYWICTCTVLNFYRKCTVMS